MNSSKNTATNTLRLNFLDGDIFGLHPNQLQRHICGRALSKLIYEGLTRINQQGEPTLAGADSVEISQDGLQYTFTLRSHMWSDGTRVTTYDYEQAWKEALSPNSTSAWAHLLYIINNAQEAKLGEALLDQVGIKALDERTLVVQLCSPTPYFLELIAQPVFLPVKYDNQNRLCFNGPFLVKRWEKEESLYLRANPDFWNREEVHLNGIDISMIRDPNTAFSMYQKGSIDWVGGPFCALSDEDLEHLMREERINKRKANRPFWIYFNTERSPFNSTAIRQAFNIAIDRKYIPHILVGNNSLYTPLPSQLTLCEPSIIYDEKLSRQLFQKGVEELRLSRDDFPKIELTYFNTPSHKRLAEYLKETWENTFGITVKLEGLEWGVFCDHLEEGLF
ncbi:MAG: peptide ABC transporter substrate-binding protein, partial [Chlamydiales bacterium]